MHQNKVILFQDLHNSKIEYSGPALWNSLPKEIRTIIPAPLEITL